MKKLSAADGSAIFLKAIIFNLLLQLVAGIVLVVLTFAGVKESTLNTVNYVFMIGFQLVYFLVVFVHLKKNKRALGYPIKAADWKVCLCGVGGALVCVFMFSYCANWLVLVLDKVGYPQTASIPLDTPLNIVLCTITVVFLAPVCEELVFRGALLGGLVKKYGVVPSVILSGLAFMLMHMNVEQTVHQFLLGCVCAYFAISARSVVPAIIVHAGNNAIALLLSFIPASGEATAVTVDPLLIVLTVGGLALGWVAVYFMGKVMAKNATTANDGMIFGRVIAEPVENVETVGETAAEAVGETVGQEVEAVAPAVVEIRCNPMLTDMRRENVDDEREYAEGKRVRLMGKRSHLILYVLTCGVCVFMSALTFITMMLGA